MFYRNLLVLFQIKTGKEMLDLRAKYWLVLSFCLIRKSDKSYIDIMSVF